MPDSPYRLTALTIAGSFLAVAGLLTGNFHAVSSSLPLLVTCFLLAVAGALGMYWSSWSLQQGVSNERWPAETLVPFRRVTGHIFWKVSMGLLVIAMFAALAQDRHHRTYYWAIFFSLQTQTQISNAFARPRKPSRAVTLLDWTQISPLRSEHWGERLDRVDSTTA